MIDLNDRKLQELAAYSIWSVPAGEWTTLSLNTIDESQLQSARVSVDAETKKRLQSFESANDDLALRHTID